MKKIYFLPLLFLLSWSLTSQIIAIPDANFKAKLLAANTTNTIAQGVHGANLKIDANNDGEIQQSEALLVYSLNVNNASILSLVGINSFSNLRNLYCGRNQLTSMDISNLSDLKILACGLNQLSSLDLTNNVNLWSLDCSSNQLHSLNLSTIINLQTLFCETNFLTALDESTLTHLDGLVCNDNQITSLNFSLMPNLINLFCYNNPIASLDLSNLVNLVAIDCSGNAITTLDVSNCINLQNLFCDATPVESIFMKNGRSEVLSILNSPNLRYICADEEQLQQVQNAIVQNGYTNCHVNSYCSFNPGGTFYSIQGNSRYDSTSNGCDSGDPVFSSLKLSFSNGTNTANLIADNTGDYRFDVQAGTHSITPLLENPTYFTITPTSATVTFPTVSSPFIQNFCVAPNGVHNDLEISLFPINIARPGFDAMYKISYKNKGTNSQNGAVHFTFDDAKMDLVSVNPIPSGQSINNLSWSFNNLQPFEKREIIVVLNLNATTETPAVNGGDILNYGGSIIGSTDETPADNMFSLLQTVVNSFDPNDKTCLEGNTITPEMVGKEVHYLIRFENTGTANAQNIVVQDLIDTTKFDIASLIPIDGSHTFVTKISNTNKVEFIFENINLPFDDAHNDGYVAFKIKTKPTLVLGDAFSNTASIYFDYNFPINTNTATTTVALLANQDFAFDHYIAIHPNPTTSVLNIDLKKNIEVTSYNIYNTLGQLLLVVPNAQSVKTIDVSSLQTGNYLMKVNSNKGTSSVKFIKQ